MKRNRERLKAATVWLVTLALLSTAVPRTARAQAKPDDEGSGRQAEKNAAKHRSRKGAFILTLAGAGAIGAGAYLMAYKPTYECAEHCVVGGPCPLCPIDFGHTTRKISGGLVIGFGSLLTVGGLLMMRRPKETPASQPDSRSTAALSQAPRRFSAGNGGTGTQLRASPTFSNGHFIGDMAQYRIGILRTRQFVLTTPDTTATLQVKRDRP
jgi:hypothetical protein